MKIKKRRRKISISRIVFSAVFAAIFFWCAMLAIDYSRVMEKNELPLFAAPIDLAEGVTSGTYDGLGYSFDIEAQEDKDGKGVDINYAGFYLWGNLMAVMD